MPRLRAFTRIVRHEVKRLRLLARITNELYTDFADKIALPQPIQNAQPGKSPVSFRHEGLAHVETGHDRTLDQQRVVARLREERRHR